MKTLRYPKTYGKLIEVKRVNENELIGHPYYANIYVYQVQAWDKHYLCFYDTEEFIEARNPASSGHTPKNAEREAVEIVQKVGRKRKQKYICHRVKMIGKIFKLYQRPQDNGRWTYRWMGQ